MVILGRPGTDSWRLLLVLLRLVAPALFPPQGGLHSQYYIGLLPSNPDGTFSRGDYWRMAGLAVAGAVACLLLWVAMALLLSAFSPPRHVMERISGARCSPWGCSRLCRLQPHLCSPSGSYVAASSPSMQLGAW